MHRRKKKGPSKTHVESTIPTTQQRRSVSSREIVSGGPWVPDVKLAAGKTPDAARGHRRPVLKGSSLSGSQGIGAARPCGLPSVAVRFCDMRGTTSKLWNDHGLDVLTSMRLPHHVRLLARPGARLGSGAWDSRFHAVSAAAARLVDMVGPWRCFVSGYGKKKINNPRLAGCGSWPILRSPLQLVDVARG